LPDEEITHYPAVLFWKGVVNAGFRIFSFFGTVWSASIVFPLLKIESLDKDDIANGLE
jgi:hypothetical protein